MSEKSPDKFWCIEVSKDEKRKFIYSEPYLMDVPTELFNTLENYFKEKTTVVCEDPDRSRMIIFGRAKAFLLSFLGGMAFFEAKEEYWQEMFDDYIDYNLGV